MQRQLLWKWPELLVNNKKKCNLACDKGPDTYIAHRHQLLFYSVIPQSFPSGQFISFLSHDSLGGKRRTMDACTASAVHRITHADSGRKRTMACMQYIVQCTGLHTLTSLKHALRRNVGKDRVNTVGLQQLPIFKQLQVIQKETGMAAIL